MATVSGKQKFAKGLSASIYILFGGFCVGFSALVHCILDCRWNNYESAETIEKTEENWRNIITVSLCFLWPPL